MENEEKSQSNMENTFGKIKKLVPMIGLFISLSVAFLKHGVPKEPFLDIMTDPFHPFIMTAGSTLFFFFILYALLLKYLISIIDHLPMPKGRGFLD